MRIQRLRHRVEVQEQITTLNSSGEQNKVWQTFVLDDGTVLDSVPAEVLLGPGRNPAPFLASQQQESVDARIMMAWFPGLTGVMRIVWDVRVFDQIGEPSSDLTGRREWRLLCRTGLNDG